MKNAFACAGPSWEGPYVNRVRRNARVAYEYRQHLIAVPFRIDVASLSLGDLSDCEVTLIAPDTSENFQFGIAQLLLKAGAKMVAAVSDVGSISIYRAEL